MQLRLAVLEVFSDAFEVALVFIEKRPGRDLDPVKRPQDGGRPSELYSLSHWSMTRCFGKTDCGSVAAWPEYPAAASHNGHRIQKRKIPLHRYSNHCLQDCSTYIFARRSGHYRTSAAPGQKERWRQLH